MSPSITTGSTHGTDAWGSPRIAFLNALVDSRIRKWWREADVPNAPRPDNRAHTVRVPDDLWARARARADEKGETVSEAVRRFLERYSK